MFCVVYTSNAKHKGVTEGLMQHEAELRTVYTDIRFE